jgi:ParB family chromosome partitioning protein
MATRQRGLGRGLGALIAPSDTSRQQQQATSSAATATPTTAPTTTAPTTTKPSPSDVFFNGGAGTVRIPEAVPAVSAQRVVTAEAEAVASAGSSAPAVEQAAAAVDDETVSGDRVVGELRILPVDAIAPNPRQPRTAFDEDALEQLTASIREVGVLQPVVVRRAAPQAGSGAASVLFELVMGERRWRATQAAGLREIPAVIRDTSDDELLREALLENLHRSELNPLEEAAAYAQLLHDFGVTHEVLAQRLGTSRSHLTNTMRLLGLSPAVQRRVAAGVLSAGHARALLSLEDSAAQDALASRIVAEGLSVRAVEELVAVAQPRRRPRSSGTGRAAAPELDHVAASLTERLDTRVKVVMGRSKGRITVEFAGVDDLQRILAAMSAGAGADGR